MAVMMSVAFSVPSWYLCQLKGSFFIWWLTWLVSLADGIGAAPYHPPRSPPPFSITVVHKPCMHHQGENILGCCALRNCFLCACCLHCLVLFCVQRWHTGRRRCRQIWRWQRRCC